MIANAASWSASLMWNGDIQWIKLDEEPASVQPPDGIVYSCRPRIGPASDGEVYYVKGPEREVVVAEHLGYTLSALVQLPTPRYGFVRVPNDGGILFASRKVRFRSAVDELLRRRVVSNDHFVSECFAFDVWIANEDRNVNNVVAEPSGGRKETQAALCAIDFEKAKVLRGVDRFSITALKPGSFRPGLALLPFCSRAPNEDMCNRIAAVTRDELARIFSDMVDAIGPVSWIDQGVDILATRAQRIHDLVKGECNA